MYPTVYAALLLLPPLAALAFALLRPHHAAAVVMIGSALFLPQRASIDFPVLPALDKEALPPLVVALALLMSAPRRLAPAGLWRRSDILIVVLVAGTLVSGLLNRDTLVYGPLVLPGMGPSDALSDTLRQVLVVVLPYFIGRACVRTGKELREFLVIVLLANLAYLPFIAFELRMSPQLHRMVYGFAQHEFAQTMRGGGYRPMVFMAHGLAVSVFVMTGAVIAWAFARMKAEPFRGAAPLLAGIMSVILVLMKSLGALVYGVLAVPLLFFARRGLATVVVVVLAGIVLTYPVSRAANVFPTAAIVELVRSSAGYDRSSSLEFRFINEDLLLAKARERMLFGWGPMGRGRVYDAGGGDAAVSDGEWVIVHGSYGTVGFIALFGLLVNAAWRAVRVAGRLPRDAAYLLLAFTWIHVFHMVDLIPNGMFSYLNVLWAGALLGAANGLEREVKERARAARRAVVPAAFMVRRPPA